MTDHDELSSEKLELLNQLQNDIDDVKEFYHNHASIGEFKRFLDLQNSLEIHSERKIMVLEQLQSMVLKAHELSEKDGNSENNHILNIYLDAFAKLSAFNLNETEAEENCRQQNHQSVQHFAEIYECEIDKLNEKLENFRVDVNDRTEEKLKFISETRDKLGDNQDAFELKLQSMSDEHTRVNEENVEKYIAVINDMEKSVDEGNQDVANNDKLWVKEVHKVAAQRLKVEQAYQMILRQFDTEIGGKADKLEDLQTELNTRMQDQETWRNEVFEPMKLRHNQMIAERKEILLQKMAARRIQKWWRKILKKRRKLAKRKARQAKLEKAKKKWEK